MIYRDMHGAEITELEFRSIFGEGIHVEHVEGAHYQVLELWDSGPDAGMDCQVEVRNGYAPDARLVTLNGGESIGSKKSNTVWETAFWAWYLPPDPGPYQVYVRDPMAASEVVHGLGWIYRTHHRHVQRIVMQRVTSPPPEPDPEPPSSVP
jgi:hypothetical protein